MALSALVEVATDLDPAIRSRLVAAAYQQSRDGVVVLALKGISRDTLDGMLDPVVNLVGLKVCGTLYVESTSLSNVLEDVGPETMVVGASPEFVRECGERGLPITSVWSALEAWEKPTASVPLPVAR